MDTSLLYIGNRGLKDSDAYSDLIKDLYSSQVTSSDFIEFLHRFLSRIVDKKYCSDVIKYLIDKHSYTETTGDEIDMHIEFRKNFFYIFKVISIRGSDAPSANDIVKLTNDELLSLCYSEKQKTIIANIEKDQFSSIMNQKNPEEMIDGVLECPMCRRDSEKRKKKLTMKTAYYERQTRSADEPATVFAMCYLCKHTWKR